MVGVDCLQRLDSQKSSIQHKDWVFISIQIAKIGKKTLRFTKVTLLLQQIKNVRFLGWNRKKRLSLHFKTNRN
jgi:hypothetical protein